MKGAYTMDMKMIGKRILDARREKGMTQMALADEMMVSYQAVSNWERGLTMPDITKLPQLCEILNLSIETLLGKVSTNPLVQKAIHPNQSVEQVTVQDIESVGAIIPTQEVDEALKSIKETCTFEEIIQIAPFASTKTLDALVDIALEKSSITSKEMALVLGQLAPFISDEKINDLVQRLGLEEQEETLFTLLPFLNEASLETLLHRYLDSNREAFAMTLVPFLNDAQVEQLAESYYQKGGTEKLVMLAPFLSTKALNRYAMTILKEHGFAAYQSLMPFIDTDEIDKILRELLK